MPIPAQLVSPLRKHFEDQDAEKEAGGARWQDWGLLRGVLEATAVLVFAQPLPGGAELGMHDSTSYAEWLHRRPDASQ